MSTVLVIAPHPDDETLGCGGTLLRHKAQGDRLYWLVMTSMTASTAYSAVQVAERARQIQAVRDHFAFEEVFVAGFAPAELDVVPLQQRVAYISNVARQVQPDIVYVPFHGDIHSDHAATYGAVKAVTKSFRYPSIRCIRAYETLSETDFSLADGAVSAFSPNCFVDISDYLPGKLDALSLYGSEMGQHPFPRSEQSVKALATLRGTVAGCDAAEAFMTLREIVR